MTGRTKGATGRLAEAALARRLRTISHQGLGRADRAPNIEHVVLESIPSEALQAALDDVSAGDGGELRQPSDPTLFPRFHSARSSCALAVNVFAPWRTDPSTLRVGRAGGYTALRFEKKLPIAGVARRPPNLDVVVEGPQTLAIESKLIEYIGPAKPADFAPVYDGAVAELATPTWSDEYSRLKADHWRYRFFNAAQIVKHYLGVKSHYAGHPVRLLYLFWEPIDHGDYPLFAQHRAEAENFAEAVEDPVVSFSWLTYDKLWNEWDGLSAPEWLPDHLELLRRRYSIPLVESGVSGSP